MTGHALIVGVSTANPAGWTAQALAGVKEDLRTLPTFFGDRDFITKTLADAAAKHDDVLGSIASSAKALNEGDFFVFAFSGHGAEKEGFGGDEAQDELLLTYDKEIVDDELGALWPTFRAGVRIVVLTDSCHSGTAYKDAVRVRDARRAVAKPVGIGIPSRGNTRDAYRIDANLIHISGCQDDEKSQDTRRGGAFSQALINAMKSDNPKDYTALHARIMSRLSAAGFSQTSQMNTVGPQIKKFESESPFDLSAADVWGKEQKKKYEDNVSEIEDMYG